MATYKEKLLDPRWQKKRLEILSRDEWECKFCGDSKKTLHVHHIGYSQNPWETPDVNLITLCQTCHEEEERQLKSSISELISGLRNSGFTSIGLSSLSKIFADTNRGWQGYEPAFDVIKMVVDDSELWNEMEKLFWVRLRERSKKTEDEFSL